jgi:hypothetical protein
LSREDWIFVPVRAYIRRKLQPVIRAVESIKVYEEGKEYMVYIATPSGETLKVRCRLLKRLDVQRFRVVVKLAGQNIQLIAPKLMELGPDEFTDEDSDDWDDVPLQPMPRPVLKHAFAHLDWSQEAYALDMQFALQAIAADFPRFQLGEKLPKCPLGDYWVTFNKSSKIRMDFDNFDYGISFAPFCTPEFLPSLSAEDHKRLMDTAAMRESFRCFFLHLAVELGVHPVALQVIARLPRVAAQTFDSRPLPLFLFVCSTCAESDAQHFQS